MFLNKIQNTGRDFQKSPEINTRGKCTEANVQNRHTRKQKTSLESKYKDT